ncbi:MAG: biotin--[acetyl-CoA-carboxylase] ligase [Bacteroidota bacterium]
MIGRKIIYKDTLDSTNNYVANLINRNEIEHGTVILAGNQTLGKGQRGAVWDSEPYKNISLSVFLKHVNLSLKHNFYLTQAISLALVDFFKEFDPNFKIKWPNDILYNNSKIAGILIETQLEKAKFDDLQIKSSIVGIGINVNQEQFGTYNATSLKLITGNEFQVQELIFKLCEKLNERINLLENFLFEQIKTDYLENLWLFQKESTYQVSDTSFKGKIVGIDEIGRLLVENLDSKEVNAYQNKEIIFLERGN